MAFRRWRRNLRDDRELGHRRGWRVAGVREERLARELLRRGEDPRRALGHGGAD